jgi:hypothetical protein
LLGPYSSRLTHAAAPIAEAAGMVLLNHGGADDGLYAKGMRMLVGVPSPASDYLVAFAQLARAVKFRLTPQLWLPRTRYRRCTSRSPWRSLPGRCRLPSVACP